MVEKEETEDLEGMRYCPFHGDRIQCDRADCEIYHNESDACSIKLGGLALEKISKILEMVHPGLMQTSLRSKASHDTLIPFALDLCESDLQDIKLMKRKTYDALVKHMDRIFANLQIANFASGEHGYGNVADINRYITVKAAFLKLQDRHSLTYDNDLI